MKAREVGINDSDTGLHIAEGLFTTITNVDFDPVSLGKKIDKALAARDRIEVMFRESFKRYMIRSLTEKFQKPAPGESPVGLMFTK